MNTESTADIKPRRKLTQDVAAAMDPDALLTVDTVAALTGYAHEVVRQMTRTGKLPPALKLGRSLRWRARDVRAWLQERGLTPPV
jgi:excisionase family DNA binding protein